MRARVRSSLVVIAVVVASLAVPLDLAPAQAAASFQAHGSVEQVYVTGLTAGSTVELLDGSDRVVASRTANALGGSLFRGVPAGSGYTVRSGGETSGPLTVDANPIASDLAPSQTTPPRTTRASTTRRSTPTATSTSPRATAPGSR